MSGGGGGKPQMMFLPQQQQTSQTSSTNLPSWVTAAGQSNYDAAANMNPAAFAAYTGQRVADMNGGQTNAINAINDNVGAANPVFSQALNTANQAYGSSIPAFQAAYNSLNNFDPSAINGAINSSQAIGNAAANYQAPSPVQGYNAQNVNAPMLANANLERYMSPYTNDVINSSLNVLDQQRQNNLNTNHDQAIADKAFGGSRQAIQDAVTNSQYGLQGSQLAANLFNQNFGQAQQAALNDINNNMQGQLANQNAQNQANQFNANLGLQNNQFGLNALNTMGNLGLSAANQAGNLGLQNANLGINQANAYGGLGAQFAGLGQNQASTLGNIATSQQNNFLNGANAGLQASNQLQQQQQNQLSAAQQQYLDQQQSMLQPLYLRMQALGMTPYNTSTSSVGNTSGFTTQPYQNTSASPLMQLAGGLLGGASTAAKLGWQPFGR